MLQQIQFHIHEDEQVQQQIERSLAHEIRENYRLSIGAFERFIPTLAELAKNAKSSVSTLLCNKFGELNIINYNSGQVLYGQHPAAEILEHFERYLSIAPTVQLPNESIQKDDAIVCLGLGLGYHLENIVYEGRFQHVVVYEPNVDYFVCALSSLNWKSIFKEASNKRIALYLQIGSDASNFVKDIEELRCHTAISRLTIYKHLNLPIFNSIENQFVTKSWFEIKGWMPKHHITALSESYLPQWAPLKESNEYYDSLLDYDLKTKNLDVLKKYFPNLYEEFSSYKPLYWVPNASKNREVSVCHKSTQVLFSSSPKNDAEISFNAFAKKPNKDGLLLSYTGKKLKGYLHYQLVSSCEAIMKGAEEVQSELPDKVKSLIMFGLGNGYGVDALMNRHEVEMLFICEPNKDFFYASLFAIDWSSIIEAFDDGKKRLYLNIGDDGTNLTNDLLVQFQTVGPYVLANTFFYQSYFNDKLTDAIAQLREQLLVIIAMGDYFDNAKYGIAHTRWALENNIPFLMKSTQRHLAAEVLDVPVFIVGNGPSLDGLLETIKEEKENAIVISCGTALQALHNNGITPDFHAEIETNRSTFDWLTRIDDPAYLQEITLLSCNGIHPDSVNLFGRTLLALKQGEASTVSLTELDKKHSFALLNFAYPTVTNFAADLVTEIGFKQIYLFGTDMGFVSDIYHHSKSSGYYDDSGKELYSYAENHAMSMVIPGNFKPWVKTKYEFKVSKGVLEQAFARSDSEVYNLNDGAKISGAKALTNDNVLIVASKESKKFAKNALLENAFSDEFNEKFISMFEKRYRSQNLIEELNALTRLLSKPIVSSSNVADLIAEQREFIVSSYLRKKSLAFYYLNGTLNYTNSMLSKLLNVTDAATVIRLGNELLEIWRQFVNDTRLIIENAQYEFDNTSSFRGYRRRVILANLWSAEPLRIEQKNGTREIKTELSDIATKNTSDSARRVTLNWVDANNPLKVIDKNVCNIAREFKSQHFKFPTQGLSLISHGDYKNVQSPFQSNLRSLTNAALIVIMSGFRDAIFLQKYSVHPHFSSYHLANLNEWSKPFNCYSGPDFIVLTNEKVSADQLILPTGDRLCFLPTLNAKNLSLETITLEKYADKVKAVDSLLCPNKNNLG